MSTLEQVLEVLRGQRGELARRGVRCLGIFGSVARGEERPDSDLDLLVELDRPSFDGYMDLKFFLEELLGRPVDLVLAHRIKPSLRDRILAELIDAA